MSEESERLEGRVIKGEAVTLGHKSRVSVVEDCTFQGCEITISCSAAGLVLIDSTFLGCTLRFTKRFSNHQFFDTTFERCEFIGRFSGCEFGFRDIEMSPRRGTIVDCTFTHAELDFVSFNSRRCCEGGAAAGLRGPRGAGGGITSGCSRQRPRGVPPSPSPHGGSR